MEPDRDEENQSVKIWSGGDNDSDISVSSINLMNDGKITIDPNALVRPSGISMIDNNVITSAWHRDDSADAIAASVYDKISEKLKFDNEKEISELKEKLKMLLELKIKTLPVISTGVYMIEFPEDVRPNIKRDVLIQIKEELNKRYGNDNILLCGINGIERITEESLDEKIKNLMKIKEELKKR